MQAFLQGQAWPEAGVPLVAEPPLAWVCPNRVAPGDPAASFRFRASAFAEGARLEVRQGATRLHTQPMPRIIVNESMPFSGARVKAVNPSGEPVRLALVPARHG